MRGQRAGIGTSDTRRLGAMGRAAPPCLRQWNSVELCLGPKFFRAPVTKTDPGDAFALSVSAYGPFLCVAQVTFTDGADPATATETAPGSRPLRASSRAVTERSRSAGATPE